MGTIANDIAKNLGLEPTDVESTLDEFMLQIHRRLFEYVGLNGDYIGEELHYQIGDQAFYHLLGFLDTFSDRYSWEPGSANEYLLRLSSRSRWAPFQHQTERWVRGRDGKD